MDWRTLVSTKRLRHDGELIADERQTTRTPFERDCDRILFSNAFRRMHDKTQVFPLPEDDVVHSRLTHSLEVASVGRSLGNTVGQTVCERHKGDIGSSFAPRDLGQVVAAACLAHDIGNPPFGHAGERAIASFFNASATKTLLEDLTELESEDLCVFEGNAQGFRVLTRLQLEADGGLQLTLATLGAFSKYPRQASKEREGDYPPGKKHGFFQAERDAFERVAETLALSRRTAIRSGYAWNRHPLAYLVEAADDICYSILDIEDGVRLKHVTTPQAEELLLPVARQQTSFNEARLNAFEERDRIGYLRATAIGRMIAEAAEVFRDNEQPILSGTFQSTLTEAMKSNGELHALRKLARERCYNAAEVLEIELAGYEALHGLLEHFLLPLHTKSKGAKLSPREEKTLELLRKRGVKLGQASWYQDVLRVTDFVSGMTDRHALSTYRRLRGIAVPGRVN